MAGKKQTKSTAKAPTKAELDKMPPGVAMALADRYGVKGYERAEATVLPAAPASE